MDRKRPGTTKTHWLRPLSRFRVHDGGATAVEFALIALPFFGLLFAIVQTSVVMFANQALQTMVSNASRKVMTGEMQTKDFKYFKSTLCNQKRDIIFDCTKLKVQVKSFDNFASANPKDFVTPDCFDSKKTAPDSCFDAGAAKKVVIVRATYVWPFGVSFEDKDFKQTLVGVSAFRAEPY
jgi:Flp pilus assembly protein TadG